MFRGQPVREADGGTVGDTIELSTLEFDVLWEHLQLGPFPTVLEFDQHGFTRDERAELTAKAWESLACPYLSYSLGT